MLLSGMLVACNNKQITNNNMEQKLELTQEWDKVFPLSEKVNHKKVTFKTQYGLTLAADLYTPASPDPSKERGEKLPAIAVSGPFGAVKEQCSGLYAMKMAERGFVALAFDPSYTGESSGEPRRTASPDINTKDFLAAVDFLSNQENVDAERIGIIGICGWGGIALNAAGGVIGTAKTFQSNASPTPTRWLEVCWIPFHHRRLTSCTTTTTITRRRAAITSVPATLTTAGASSVHKPTPTAVSSTTSTRSALLFS